MAAFRKSLTQRLFNISRITNCRVSSPSTIGKPAATSSNQSHPSNKPAHDPGDDGIFRRHFHLQSAEYSPELRLFPTGEKLREKLRGMDVARERIRIREVMPPPLIDAKKILRLSQLESVKSRLRGIQNGVVCYSEFLQICVEECESEEQGADFARLLDESGAVIVLGNNVFLRPEQVVQAIQALIPSTIPSFPNPNDPIMKEFQEMEKQISAIDKKAEFQVRRELWCGLGYLVVQTAAFMRLTFWELTWDVMEPICFYVTSMYFMGGYAFFLRTSKEPSFEGFFQSRFLTKRGRLMKAKKFDIERYNQLKKICYPDLKATRESGASFSSPVLDC